jgi:hypothetical protein
MEHFAPVFPFFPAYAAFPKKTPGTRFRLCRCRAIIEADNRPATALKRKAFPPE